VGKEKEVGVLVRWTLVGRNRSIKKIRRKLSRGMEILRRVLKLRKEVLKV
jgi:hypothetical protein